MIKVRHLVDLKLGLEWGGVGGVGREHSTARPGGETQGASGERAGSPGRYRALQSRWGGGVRTVASC